jgi:hypothetical protein
MATEAELLQQILNELKDIKAEQQTTNQRLLALETNTKFTHAVLGEIQGDIEELQADTQYLAMRKIIDKRNRILKDDRTK